MNKTNLMKETVTQHLSDAIMGCSARLPDGLCVLNDKAVRNAKFMLNPTSVVITDTLTGEEIDVKKIFKKLTDLDDFETISPKECITAEKSYLDKNQKEKVGSIFPYKRVKNTLVEFISQIKLGDKIDGIEKATKKGTVANQFRYVINYDN